MIPGYLISWVTFPGVVMHEIAHALFCALTGTTVRRICLFQLSTPSGYVLHEHPSNIWKHMLIGVGPFILNTSIGLCIGILLTMGATISSTLYTFISFIVYWVAISIAMHSFPSTGDAKEIWKSLWQPETSIYPRIVGIPLVAILFAGALASIFWVDLLYGILIVIEIPHLIFR
jgi:uncharacterized protein YggT (Ycf19 family)